MDNRPLILLVFASDQGEAHLKSISEERQVLLDLLQSEPVKKLDYEIRLIDHSSVDGVLRALVTNSERLFFLHFAGHSGTNFLQFDQGRAYVDSIAEQLKKCPKLKVVFFNGCENTGLVKALKSIDIPYIVGTRKPVNDELAKQFSRSFFDALINQEQSIQSAFQNSLNALHFTKNKKLRSLDLTTDESGGNWAWIAEFIDDEWTFATSANDCNRLPEINAEKYPLPNEPFKGLHPYTEADAAVFFGRCSDTLSVLESLADPERIFILQGRSGAGKTSFVKAGLIPYLRNKGVVVYFDTVSQGEVDCGGADFLIVDHAEKLLRRPIEVIKKILGLNCKKTIFSVRTEWFGELTDQLINKYNLITNNYLLKPLTNDQIIEIFSSVEKLKNTKYRIEIENPTHGSLAEVIINDIKSDVDSATAPMLQLLLKNIYAEIKNNDNRVINIELYEKFRKKGLGIIAQIKNKLAIIGKKDTYGKESYNSGLLIDILNTFTTEYNTSKAIKEEYLEKLYQHIPSIDKIIIHLEDEHLIMTFYDEQSKTYYKKLAHDSLSKYIKIIYNESGLPGQLSRREINHIKRSWENAHRNTGNLIDPKKLHTVELGLKGTYDVHFDEIETEIIQKSKSENRKKRNIKLLTILAFLIIVSPFFIILMNLSKLFAEIDITDSNKEYRSLKLYFKDNNKQGDDYIISNHQATIRKLNSIEDESAHSPSNKAYKYAMLQDIHLILSVVNYRSEDTNNTTINKLTQLSELQGSKALAFISKVDPPEEKRKNDIIFNLLYAKSMQVCTGSKKLEYIMPTLGLLDKEYLENTTNEKNDTCLVETLTKSRKIHHD